MIVKSFYDTKPSLVHMPDSEKNPYWNYFTMHSCNKKKQIDLSSDITIITWNNLDKGCFEKSLESHGVPYVLKGTKDHIWSNYNKFKYNIELAKKCGTKYMMGCDSHDVFFIGDICRVVEEFKKTNCKMLFNSEKFFYPNFQEGVLQKCKKFQEDIGCGRYVYLNAGVWIGETKFCLDFFNRANEIRVYDLFDCSSYEFLKRSSIGCDQSSLHYIFPEFYPDVKLDYNCDIVVNASISDGLDLKFEYPEML